MIRVMMSQKFEAALRTTLTRYPITGPTAAWEAELHGVMVDGVLPEIQTSGTSTFQGTKLLKLIEGTFDAIDPNVITAAERQAARLVTNVSPQIRRSIRDAVIAAQRAELDRDSLVRMLRSIVGPTERDALTISRNYINNYQRALKEGLTPVAARGRAGQIADRARDIAVRRRAKMIGRTETRMAQQEGRRAGWRQANADGLIPTGTQRVWLSADPCPICAPWEGVKVGWNEEFPVGDPPLHPNCRCTQYLLFPEGSRSQSTSRFPVSPTLLAPLLAPQEEDIL